MNLKFSGRGLAYLSHFMAKRDIRYYLNGVCFTPLPPKAGGGVLGAATNGQAIGLWYDPNGTADRKVIATISKQMAAACKKPETFIENIDGRLTCVQRKAKEQGIGWEIYTQPTGKPLEHIKSRVERWEIEGTYPDLTRVVLDPSYYDQGFEGVFNSKYLGILQRAAAVGSDSTAKKFGAGITMRQRHKDDGIFVTFDLIPEAMAIVMPMRQRDMGDGVPWLRKWRAWAERTSKATNAPLPVHEPSDAGPPDGDGRGRDIVQGERP